MYFTRIHAHASPQNTFVPSSHPLNVNWCLVWRSEKERAEGNDDATLVLLARHSCLSLGSRARDDTLVYRAAAAGARCARQPGRIKHCRNDFRSSTRYNED